MKSSSASNSINTLCDVCTAAVPSIRRLLFESEPDEPGSPVPLSLIRHIQAKKDTCALCKLVDHALVQSWPEVPLWSGVHMYNPMKDTQAVLVSADSVTDLWERNRPKNRPRCLRVEITLDGTSSFLTQARDMAGFKIDTNKRSFQSEIRLLQQTTPDPQKEKNDVGLAREFGRICSADRLKGWYRRCVDDSSHHESCAIARVISEEAFDKPSGQPTPLPKLPGGTRLIDVDAMKLVPAGQRHDIEFAALSYVWGEVHPLGLDTTKMNVDERELDGSLRNAPLPKTISDALQVTRDVGIPFLWVDALCIVQDPSPEKDLQINAMDKVYGLASLVIVAAAGSDSEAGLVGTLTSPRAPVNDDRDGQEKGVVGSQVTGHVQDLYFAVSPPPLQHILATSTWYTRGWTYQEWHFARRSLIFTSTQVFFLCGCMSFSEDLVLENGSSVPVDWQMISQRGPAATDRHWVPSMKYHGQVLGVSSGWGAYVDAVQNLSPRFVRDPRDILKSLAGILGNLHRATRNRFVAGMSVGLFHDALLWVPVAGDFDRQLLKRVGVRPAAASKDPHGWRTGGKWLPSWSWAEWDGPVKYGDIPAGKSLVEEFKVVYTEPGLGSRYMVPADTEEIDDILADSSEDDGGESEEHTAPVIRRSWIRRLFRRGESRTNALSRELARRKATEERIEVMEGRFEAKKARLEQLIARRQARQLVLRAHLLGRPLAEPQTDRPIPGMTYFGRRPQLHGDGNADGTEAEAKREGKALSIAQVAPLSAAIGSVSPEGAPNGQLLSPIYSHKCGLFFTGMIATVQIAPVLDDIMGRAEGLLDLAGRYIGVALMDQPMEEIQEAFVQSFLKVEVVALSHSEMPTRYLKEKAFLEIAGMVGEEHPEWIGALILSEMGDLAKRASKLEEKDTDGKKQARSFGRLGVAQISKKAWDMWVDKKEEEILLL